MISLIDQLSTQLNRVKSDNDYWYKHPQFHLGGVFYLTFFGVGVIVFLFFPFKNFVSGQIRLPPKCQVHSLSESALQVYGGGGGFMVAETNNHYNSSLC